MTTKAKYRNGRLTFYESSSFEHMPVGAEVVFEDDFLGTDLMTTETGSTGIWDTVQVALNTAMAFVADAAAGQLSMAFDADVNAEDAVLFWSDQRGIDLKQGAIIEFGARASVLPTLTSQIVMGFCGDHNLDKDAATESVWFKLDGDGVVVLESDDTTNNNDDKASGITVVAADWHRYRIDCTTLADVLFYIDGANVNSGTTFDMSNLTDAEAIMQPYFSLDKGADAGLGTLLLDYVRIWSKRGY